MVEQGYGFQKGIEGFRVSLTGVVQNSNHCGFHTPPLRRFKRLYG